MSEPRLQVTQNFNLDCMTCRSPDKYLPQARKLSETAGRKIYGKRSVPYITNSPLVFPDTEYLFPGTSI